MFNRIFQAVRFMFDRRVPISLKMVPALALVYIISPIDLIPEAFLMGLGFADDIALAIWVVNYFVDRASREVKIVEAYDAPTRKHDSIAKKKEPMIF